MALCRRNLGGGGRCYAIASPDKLEADPMAVGGINRCVGNISLTPSQMQNIYRRLMLLEHLVYYSEVGSHYELSRINRSPR